MRKNSEKAEFLASLEILLKDSSLQLLSTSLISLGHMLCSNVIDTIILRDIVSHEVGKPDASVTILFKDVVLELLADVLLLLLLATVRSTL